MANPRGFWSDEKIAALRELAAEGKYGSEIGAELGCSLHSVLTISGIEGILLNRYTPAEQAIFEENYRAREARKSAKAKLQADAKKRSLIKFYPGTSKTSPIYRNSLPKIPDNTSKNELRAMLAQAMQNTAEAQHGPI